MKVEAADRNMTGSALPWAAAVAMQRVPERVALLGRSALSQASPVVMVWPVA